MKLEDLQQDVTQMSDDDLTAFVQKIRSARLLNEVTPKKSKAKRKKRNNLAAMLKKLPKEQQLELLQKAAAEMADK